MKRKLGRVKVILTAAILALCLGTAVTASAEAPRTETVTGYQMILDAAAAQGEATDGTLIRYNIKHGDASGGEPQKFTTASSDAGSGALGDVTSTTAAWASWGVGGKWQLFSAKDDGILFEIVAKENLSLTIEKVMGDIGWVEPAVLSVYGKDAEGGMHLLKQVAFTQATQGDKSLYGGTFQMLKGETLYYQFCFEWEGGRNMQGPPQFTATETDGSGGGVGDIANYIARVQERFDAFAATLAEDDYEAGAWEAVRAEIAAFTEKLADCKTIGDVDDLYSASVTAIESVKPKLAVYKTRKAAALTAYIETLGRDNYDATGIDTLEAKVTAFTDAVADADGYDAVDAAYEAAKTGMDGVRVKLPLYAQNLKALLDKRVAALNGTCTFDEAGAAALEDAVAAFAAASAGFAGYEAADAAYAECLAAISAVVPLTEKFKMSDTVTAVINNTYEPAAYTLASYGFYYGTLDAQKKFTVHTGDGTGSADDALLQGQTAVKRWQLEAAPGTDVIMKLTAARNISLTYTHRATDFPDGLVWSTHTGLRFVTEDTEGTRYVVRNTLLASTMPENAYSLTVHLAAGESFYIDYYALNAWGSIDFEPNFTASTVGYDAELRPDYAALREMEADKTQKCAALDAYVDGLVETDFSFANWSRILALLDEGKANVAAAQDVDTLASAYAAADAALKGVMTLAQEAEALAAYKTQKLGELKSFVDSLDRDAYTEAEWAEVQKAVETFESALDGYTTATKVDVGFAAAKANVEAVSSTASKKGCGCGGAVSAGALALGLPFMVAALLIALKRKSKTGER